MPAYIALLRAVNVGGTGKLSMTTLASICEESGLTKVRTYIASGNVVFASRLSQTEVRRLLEQRLRADLGKPVDVLIRTVDEMIAVLAANPFAERAANRTVAIFLQEAPPVGVVATAAGRDGEELAVGKREIYVFYAEGMANSKLRIPAAKTGTARNMNTLAKLVEMASTL